MVFRTFVNCGGLFLGELNVYMGEKLYYLLMNQLVNIKCAR